jgi:hypothetical protein
LYRVKIAKLAEVDTFDVASNAAFGKGQCHPRFEAMDDLGQSPGMLRQEIIQAVRPSHHQGLEPRWALAITTAQAIAIDKHSLTKITVYGRLAFGLRQHSETAQVVAFP